MAGLVDIAAVTETVTVGGVKIEVPGVSAAGIASLLARFPDLRKLMTGKEVEVDDLIVVGPPALAAILAAGTGAPGDEAAEAAAAELPVGTQADVLAAIVRVTLPGGIHPFVEKLSGLGLLVAGPEGAAAPSAKARGMKSRKRSKN